MSDIRSLFKAAPTNVEAVIKLLAQAFSIMLAAAVILISSADKLVAADKKSGKQDVYSPSSDELLSGADELPDEFKSIIFEREYPLGLGIYDKLFTEDDPITPDGELKIVDTDLSKNALPGQILIKNNTSYQLNIKAMLTMEGKELDMANKPETSEPLVLIYHTHGTEGYAEEGKMSYSPSSLPRSTDITKNVVAVGKALCDILNANGIPTLHCTIMHDNGSYNTAYSNSAGTIKKYLKQYPSIKYAFDIHRDALVSSTTVYKTITYDESTPLAQIMFVVGTDSAGAVHNSWRRCLSFAVNAQYYLASRLNNLVRPISIKRSSYNQQYAYIGALIEVGTCANTLKEALASAEILGNTLSSMILSNIELNE